MHIETARGIGNLLPTFSSDEVPSGSNGVPLGLSVDSNLQFTRVSSDEVPSKFDESHFSGDANVCFWVPLVVRRLGESKGCHLSLLARCRRKPFLSEFCINSASVFLFRRSAIGSHALLFLRRGLAPSVGAQYGC